MTTYQELKSLRYIDGIVAFAERLLDIKFKPTGWYRYSAYCPFHADRKMHNVNGCMLERWKITDRKYYRSI